MHGNRNPCTDAAIKLIRIELWLSATFHRSLHHIAHIGTHDGLHHLAGTLELLQKLVHLRK